MLLLSECAFCLKEAIRIENLGVRPPQFACLHVDGCRGSFAAGYPVAETIQLGGGLFASVRLVFSFFDAGIRPARIRVERLTPRAATCWGSPDGFRCPAPPDDQ